jgi:methylaspartate mutase epsilon subunit
MIFSLILVIKNVLGVDPATILTLLNPYTILGFLCGGSVIYWFTGASTQAVTTGAYRAVAYIKDNINLEEAADYLKKVPEHKNFSAKLKKAKNEGITLAQPRAGVALIDAHIELLTFLQNEGGADLLPSTIDSYTRQNKYNECEIGMKESEKAGRSMLNGFPVVNHGVSGCRRVFEAVNLPLQARHGTPDARLLSEIIHASGWTSNEGGGISYNIPYAKSVSLERTLLDWQYCDRLVGIYEEMGIHLNREPFGPLTGTLVPPSMSNAVAIIEGLLAAEQGVVNITLGYGQ